MHSKNKLNIYNKTVRINCIQFAFCNYFAEARANMHSCLSARLSGPFGFGVNWRQTATRPGKRIAAEKLFKLN